MKRDRGWIYVALTLVGGIIGGALSNHLWGAATAAAAEKKAKTITAEKFVLTDASGVQRAMLSIEPDQDVSLILNDLNGKERAELRAGRNGGASVGFFNEAGDRLVGVGATADGRAGLGIYGDGKVVAGFSTTPGGGTGLTLYDPETGLARLGLGSAPSGEPALLLLDKAGVNRVELSLTKEGKPGVAFANEKGKTVAGYPQAPPSN